ncbi:30S ribosomal protein S6 [Candidatus Saccharibacteria bacterium]|nr:30S ribosomal protein S6 [Candidatus Saccharibacteria bacterium]
MKDYELVVLFHPDLEMNLDPALNKVKTLIETANGKIVKEEAEGTKRIAYAIKGQDYAVFHFYELQLPAEAPHKISSTLNITDEVLRYLLVKKDERKEKYDARRKESKKETTEESKEEA